VFFWLKTQKSYAARTAASAFGRQQQLSDMWVGMTQVSYIAELAKDPEAVLDRLLREFAEIEQHLRVGLGNVRVQVNSSSKVDALEQSMAKWWNPAVLDSSRFVFVKSTPPALDSTFRRQLFFPVPSQVNFVARAVRTGLSYTHPDAAALSVGAKVLSSCFLHREIREKGGAYGGGSALSLDGTLSLTSYRDPHLTKTLDTFRDGICRWISDESSMTDRDIREAKLSLFASIDQPVPPGSRGLGEFSSAISHEQREQKRAELLAVSKSDVMRAFKKHVGTEVLSVAALGSDQLQLEDSWTRKKI
jgi:Zn-dependent M16 (insulinase) family peptidase